MSLYSVRLKDTLYLFPNRYYHNNYHHHFNGVATLSVNHEVAPWIWRWWP